MVSGNYIELICLTVLRGSLQQKGKYNGVANNLIIL